MLDKIKRKSNKKEPNILSLELVYFSLFFLFFFRGSSLSWSQPSALSLSSSSSRCQAPRLDLCLTTVGWTLLRLPIMWRACATRSTVCVWEKDSRARRLAWAFCLLTHCTLHTAHPRMPPWTTPLEAPGPRGHALQPSVGRGQWRDTPPSSMSWWSWIRMLRLPPSRHHSRFPSCSCCC